MIGKNCHGDGRANPKQPPGTGPGANSKRKLIVES